MSAAFPILAAGLALALATPARAEPHPPVAAPGIEIVAYGVYCQRGSAGRTDAPDAILGYVNIMAGDPDFRFPQQQVPAALNVSFGLAFVPSRTAGRIRMETHIPGRDRPSTWYSDMAAGERKSRGYTFEYPEELVLGLWRLDAWDGATLLYSVEFEVVPPEQFPGIVGDCNPLS